MRIEGSTYDRNVDSEVSNLVGLTEEAKSPNMIESILNTKMNKIYCRIVLLL